MALPRIVVNAKVYGEVTGSTGVLRLERACRAVAKATGAAIALAPPQVELSRLAATKPAVPLYAQHVDARLPGVGTGWVTVEAVAAAGAVGSILNHAEHKLDHDVVGETVHRLHAKGLASLVCADSLHEAVSLAAFRPRMLAIEPPELIGGDVSVTTADPGIVAHAVQAVHEVSPRTKVLCGAGVKTKDDVVAARKLGAFGVLLASGVVKAKDQTAALRGLAEGL